jgi:hypothetical protein
MPLGVQACLGPLALAIFVAPREGGTIRPRGSPMTIPVDERMARLEGSYEQIRDRLNSIDGRLASIDARFVQVDGRFAQIDGRFAALEQKIDSRFSWLLGIVVTSWVTTILTILFHR